MEPSLMTQYFFDTQLCMDSGTSQRVTVAFDYFLPEHHRDWHDPFMGSIYIREVELDSSWHKPCVLSVMEHIWLKHECWAYIERHDLTKKHNIIPLFY
jgi:hypothetical protein